MIDAHIETNFLTRGHKVWIFDRGGPLGVRFLRAKGDGVYEWYVRKDEHASPEPTIELPDDALEALLRVASGFVPATDATVDALSDARGVRDRLLAMIEQRGIR